MSLQIINLVKSQLVSSTHLLNHICSGLDTLGTPESNALLASIHPNHDDFRISLCKRYISRLSEGEQTEAVNKKPRPRARPVAGAAVVAQPTPAPPSSQVQVPFPLPSTQEIISLLPQPCRLLLKPPTPREWQGSSFACYQHMVPLVSVTPTLSGHSSCKARSSRTSSDQSSLTMKLRGEQTTLSCCSICKTCGVLCYYLNECIIGQ